jgi:hypothetical protein
MNGLGDGCIISDRSEGFHMHNIQVINSVEQDAAWHRRNNRQEWTLNSAHAVRRTSQE